MSITSRLHPEALPTEQLVRRIESIETLLSQMARQLPSLEVKLDGLRELFGHHRKDQYTIAEISELVGRSEYTVRRWVANGRLRAVRLAEGGPKGRLLIPREELDRLVADGRGEHIPNATFDLQIDEPNT